MNNAGLESSGSNVFDPSMVDAIISTGETPRAGREFLQQILTLSLERADSMLAQLYAAHDGGDQPAVRKCAHQLISSLGNLGALEVVKICRSIQEGDDPASDIGALPPAYNAFRTALAQYVRD